MDLSTCPFCHLPVSCLELERHANSHFEDEQLARDIELAKQISIGSYLLPDNVLDIAMPSETKYSKKPEIRSLKCEGSSSSDGGIYLDEKFCYVLNLQIKENFYKVNDSLMALLRNCLEQDSENRTSILSGYVDHFQSIEFEDVGWGCGWRNIQMLSSHLLKQRQEAREVLFGGSGFVPNIASLQRWLELSWERGFDAPGSNDFDCEIYGKRNWIGTTECAALLRSFGLRARIVDFCGASVVKGKVKQIYGPMDKFLSKGDQCTSLVGSSGLGKPNYSCAHLGKGEGHHILIDWVWNYFSDDRVTGLSNQRVIVTDKAPLYFQHDGHSRTIVGIQVKSQRKGMQKYNLLVLDPGHKTKALERSLKDNSGWQMLIKRGVHTLKKLQYQLCYIDHGIAGVEDMEKFKTLDCSF